MMMLMVDDRPDPMTAAVPSSLARAAAMARKAYATHVLSAESEDPEDEVLAMRVLRGQIDVAPVADVIEPHLHELDRKILVHRPWKPH